MNPIKLLIVGGSYGGLSTLKNFVKSYNSLATTLTPKVEIYLIDKRAGLLNILGIPRAIVDVEFAKKIYLNLERHDLKFDTVESTNPEFKQRALNAKSSQPQSEGLRLHFIHGKVLNFTNENTVSYQLNNDTSVNTLSFDYAVVATGRSRQWPIDPLATTEDEFVNEIESYKPKIDSAQNITIIGAGALGIEVAGEIKDVYPNKNITLIHPYGHLPPEVYASPRFSKILEENIRDAKINLRLNTRVKETLQNEDLVTTNGEIISSDLNIWCTSHPNNIQPFLPVFKDSIDPVKNEVIVETNHLIKGHENVFAVGDIVNLPIIKTAGATVRQGQRVAQSLTNIIINGEKKYDSIELENIKKGMTVIVGVKRTITQYDNVSEDGQGDVAYNQPGALHEYADYLTTKVSRKLDINKL